MPTTPDSTLAHTRRSNADLQRENAELRRTLDERTQERDEALQRETATAEVLQVINSSPGDLAPTFEAILEKALRLRDANYGHINRYDGQFLEAVAVRGPERYVEWMRQRGPITANPESPIGRAVHGDPVVHIPDVLEDESYRARPGVREQVEAGGWRSALAVALRKEGTTLD